MPLLPVYGSLLPPGDDGSGWFADLPGTMGRVAPFGPVLVCIWHRTQTRQVGTSRYWEFGWVCVFHLYLFGLPPAFLFREGRLRDAGSKRVCTDWLACSSSLLDKRLKSGVAVSRLAQTDTMELPPMLTPTGVALGVIVVYAILILGSTVTFGLRLYVRLGATRGVPRMWGWDDTLIVLGYVSGSGDSPSLPIRL